MRTPRLAWMLLVAVVAVVGALALAGCGSSDTVTPTATTFVPLATATPTTAPRTQVAQTQVTRPRTIAPTVAPTVATQQQQQSSDDESPAASGPPDHGDWIDVNVSSYTVSLMKGTAAVQVIGPVAVGAQIDTGAYESTQTGLFHVYSMNSALTYDAPYKTYISDWVGFDPNLANGFHSFLKDADGQVVDASTGNISNGCIRTPDPQAIYDFASIGMPVYVHR